jgi:hypothetical protein
VGRSRVEGVFTDIAEGSLAPDPKLPLAKTHYR